MNFDNAHSTTCSFLVRVGTKSIQLQYQDFINLPSFETKARFKRRILHVPDLMQMSEDNRFYSFALDSAHVKYDV